MLKLKDIFRVAKDGFIPSLNKLGFYRHGRKNTFIRKNGEIFHLISFAASRWGDKFYVSYDVWSPYLSNETTIDKKSFDNGINSINLGDNLSLEGIDGNPSFKFRKTDNEHRELLVQILELIEIYALPWFSYLSNRENLVRLYSLKKIYESGYSETIDNINVTRDISEIEDIFPEAEIKVSVPTAHPLIEFGQEMNPQSNEIILNSKLNNFIKNIESFGYSYHSAPRNYFYKKSGDIHHFIDLHFESDGLFLNVAIRFLINGLPYVFVISNEKMEDCQIGKDLPTKYISPVFYYLRQVDGSNDFPVYNKESIQDSTSALICDFNTIQNIKLFKCETIPEFANAVEKAFDEQYLISPECENISQIIL